MKGGTLVATYQGEPQGLDPAIDWEGQGWAIEHTMFNNFIKYASKPGTAGTEMLPDLATEVPTQENGGIADDGTTYTFHLSRVSSSRRRWTARSRPRTSSTASSA